jgi:hypothetical protein
VCECVCVREREREYRAREREGWRGDSTHVSGPNCIGVSKGKAEEGRETGQYQ